MTTKTDYKKVLKEFYTPSGKGFSIVTVPPLNYLMVDGRGDPNKSPAYADAVEALYSVAFALKFMAKKTLEQDYTVMPLEGLWWSHDNSHFVTNEREAWEWTMMIMQPDMITKAMVQSGIESSRKKKPLDALDALRLERYDEGEAAQILYTGAYTDEGETIARLHQFIHDNGYEPTGKHHEVYLSDPRRVAAEKLKTVLRQPIQRKA
jgi:hypothetical protein